MRTLSNIALTNFVVPTMISIAQFVYVYHNVNTLVLNQIILVNTMFATFGVVFATVWAGSTNRREPQLLDLKRHDNHTWSHPMPVFAIGNGSAGIQSAMQTSSTLGHTTTLLNEKASE